MPQFIENQPITPTERDSLVSAVTFLRDDGWRLVHIACTLVGDQCEVTYAFDKDDKLSNLRVMVPNADPWVPSISGLLLAAFTYENELQDLFGIVVRGLVLDFKGSFYRKAKGKPFHPDPPAPAAAAAPQPAKA